MCVHTFTDMYIEELLHYEHTLYNNELSQERKHCACVADVGVYKSAMHGLPKHSAISRQIRVATLFPRNVTEF